MVCLFCLCVEILKVIKDIVVCKNVSLILMWYLLFVMKYYYRLVVNKILE